MPVWILIFVAIPLLELYVLIQVGSLIGAGFTVILVVLTAVAGVALLRMQGLSTLARGRQRLQSGEVPAREMVEGMLLAVAGGLLLTPGFLTDAIGFALLLPGVRRLISRRLLGRFRIMVGPGGPHSSGGAPGGRFDEPHARGGQIIDGDYEKRDDGPPHG